MEDRKTFFDYAGQVFLTFGITITVLNVFCVLFGEEAEGFSTMFALGGEGLPAATVFQFLLSSVFMVAARYLFFTDAVIKKLSLPLRTVCMLAADTIVIIVFVAVCGWFPVDRWQPWAMFFLSFGICFGIGTVVVTLKERAENRKMEAALKRLKQKRESGRKTGAEEKTGAGYGKRN